jgi:hypothetical protein
MKTQIIAALFGLGMLSAAPAFAQGPGEHPNGTVHASMMSNGDVKLMVTMPEKEFQAMGRAMKTGHEACTVQEIYPGATNTMVLVCNSIEAGGG